MKLIQDADGKWKECYTIYCQTKKDLDTLVECSKYHWRLVSEELPKPGEPCLVTIEDEIGWSVGIAYMLADRWKVKGREVDGNVTAWMPLPKPYSMERQK